MRRNMCLCVFTCTCVCVYGFSYVFEANNFNPCSQAVIIMHKFKTVSLANSSLYKTLKPPDITAQRANTYLLDHNAATHKPLCFSWCFELWLSHEKPNEDKWSVVVDRCKSFPWKAGQQSVYKRWQMFLPTSFIDDVIIKSAKQVDTVVLLLYKHTHTHTHTHTQPLCCVVTACVGVFHRLTKDKVSINFRFGPKWNCVISLESEEEEKDEVTSCRADKSHFSNILWAENSRWPMKCPSFLHSVCIYSSTSSTFYKKHSKN